MGVKVRKRKSKWYVVVDYHGRRKSKCVGTREAAEKVRREIEARLALGEFDMSPNSKAPTLEQYSDRWLREYAEINCKPSTAGFYSQYLRLHVKPKFGQMRIDAITRDQVKAWIAELCSGKLSKNSVRLAVTTLRTVLNAAREDGQISTNPAEKLGRLVKTEKPKHEASALTADEAEQLLSKAKETCSPQDSALLMTALRAGLRRGELVALKWGDLQFGASEKDTNRYLLVQRNYDHRWARAFTTTKSKKPRRVDMGRELRQVLVELRDERLIKAYTEGRSSIADDLVFPSEAGTPLEINNFVTRIFEPLLVSAGLRRIRFHDLRHTYGSLLIQGGASLAYVQRMMGHASIQTTVDTYVHLLPGGDIDFSDRLDSLTSPRQNATPAQPQEIEAIPELAEVISNEWLGGRDSNPDTQIQSLLAYR